MGRFVLEGLPLPPPPPPPSLPEEDGGAYPRRSAQSGLSATVVGCVIMYGGGGENVCYVHNMDAYASCCTHRPWARPASPSPTPGPASVVIASYDLVVIVVHKYKPN